MSKLMSNKRGGFIAAAPTPHFAAAHAILANVPEVSYLSRIRVGNNQGTDGACALFALASWATVMFPERHISDAERLALYAAVRGNSDGLTVGQAFAAAAGAGWLPGLRSIRQAASLQPLTTQPMLAAYRIGEPWGDVSDQGCLDHSARLPGPNAVLHMVLIAAAGNIATLPGREWIYIENSWGLDWGWNGIGVMGFKLHSDLLHSLYILGK